MEQQAGRLQKLELDGTSMRIALNAVRHVLLALKGYD